MVRLRPYQEVAVADLRNAYATGARAPLLCSATGSGKTVMFAAITHGARGRGNRVLILAHRVELIRQASAKLADAGVPHGIIAPGFTANHELAQVGSVQTLARRLDKLPAFDLIVIDECFPAGTPIDGRPIEEIQIGDMVRAFDPETMAVGTRAVTRLFKSRADTIALVSFASGRSISCTPNHPFFTTVGWKDAQSLAEGCLVYVDPIQDASGPAITKPGHNQVPATIRRRPGRSVQPVDPSVLDAGTKQEAAQETGNLGHSWLRACQCDRVVGVEVFQRGRDPEFDRLCADGYVYNLEVEGVHTYFAGGVAVHNCHHSVAGQYLQIIKAQPKAKLLGVSATPERLDGRGLGTGCGGVFDRLVLGPSVADLVSGGYLTDSRVFAPAGGGPDLSSVRTIAGDYDAKQLADAMDKPSVTGNAVSEYGKHAPGKPAIVFCVSVQHAMDTAEMFRAAGWRAVGAHGGMKPAERDAALGGLATGAVHVVCAADLISEGLDVPVVGCTILLRPTKSLGLHLQQIGRGLRPAPGKSHLIVLDHAGNTLRHGFAETPREWSLDGRKKKDRTAVAIRQCPECYAVHPPAQRCPACGHSYMSDEPKQARQIEAREGDLAEVDMSRIERLRAAPLKDALKDAKTREQLAELAAAKGYKPGWVHHILAARAQHGRAA